MDPRAREILLRTRADSGRSTAEPQPEPDGRCLNCRLYILAGELVVTVSRWTQHPHYAGTETAGYIHLECQPELLGVKEAD